MERRSPWCQKLLIAVLLCVSETAFATDLITSSEGSIKDLFATIAAERTLVFGDRLTTSLSATSRLVIQNKCRTEGEEELLALTMVAKVEEAYIFIPDECLWIEAGSAETPVSVHLDDDVVKAVRRHYRTIDLYHTHIRTPRASVDYFPGYSDLLSLIMISGPELLTPEVKIRHRVATPLGMIEYSLGRPESARKLLRKINRTGLTAHSGQNLAYEYARPRHRELYFAAVKWCRERTQGDMSLLSSCFPMVAGDILLTFRPVRHGT